MEHGIGRCYVVDVNKEMVFVASKSDDPTLDNLKEINLSELVYLKSGETVILVEPKQAFDSVKVDDRIKARQSPEFSRRELYLCLAVFGLTLMLYSLQIPFLFLSAATSFVCCMWIYMNVVSNYWNPKPEKTQGFIALTSKAELVYISTKNLELYFRPLEEMELG